MRCLIHACLGHVEQLVNDLHFPCPVCRPALIPTPTITRTPTPEPTPTQTSTPTPNSTSQIGFESSCIHNSLWVVHTDSTFPTDDGGSGGEPGDARPTRRPQPVARGTGELPPEVRRHRHQQRWRHHPAGAVHHQQGVRIQVHGGGAHGACGFRTHPPVVFETSSIPFMLLYMQHKSMKTVPLC